MEASNIKDYINVRLKLCALRLLKTREERELTLTDVAKQLGYSPTTVSNYEMGKRTPTLEYLSAFAKTYKVSFEWITGGEAEGSLAELEAVYRGLSDMGQKELLQYAYYLKERGV